MADGMGVIGLTSARDEGWKTSDKAILLQLFLASRVFSVPFSQFVL